MIFFIDPMSYGNLAVYDYSLLSNNKNIPIHFFASSLYDGQKFPSSVNFIPFFTYNKKKNVILKMLSYVLSLLKLFFITIKNKPQLVHIQWIRMFAIDICFLFFLKLCKIKIIYTAHNVMPHESANIKKKQYKIYYKYFTGIIVHSEKTKQELIEIFSLMPSKIYVIPHGVLDLGYDESKINSLAENLKNEMNLNKKIVISMLGIQSFYKGSDLIVKLWSECKELQNQNKYQLLFWGQNNKINTQAIENIQNVSIRNEYLTNEDFVAALRITDVLLLPYKNISQSGVLLTAIHESTPFLVSSVGGLEEPLLYANVGWNIGNPTYDNFKNRFLNIIANEKDISEKKNNKDEWSILKNKYSWENISATTFKLYEKLIN